MRAKKISKRNHFRNIFNKCKKHLFSSRFLLFVLLFLILSIIRIHQYERWPGPAHAEELMYSWSGLYLIEEKVPVAWSTLDYPEKDKVFEGVVGKADGVKIPVALFKPWLDEPPLYSLIVGFVAHSYKDDRHDVVPAAHARIPTVLASIGTMLLVFLVAFRLFDYKVGMLSLLFYGTSPIFVFGSRLSVPENIFAFFFVGSVLLIKSYLHKPRFILALFFGISSAILGLMKPTGFFFAPFYLYFAIKSKKWSHAFLISTLTLLGIVAFISYGFYYDKELFLNILKVQGSRFPGWTSLGYVLSSPAHDIYQVFDGWYIFSLIASIYYLIRHKQNKNVGLLSFFFVYWLLVALFSGTEQDLLPWYRYPLFPIMSIFGGLLLMQFIKKPTFFASVIVIGLLISSRYYLHNAFRPTTPPWMFRFLYFAALTPSLYFFAFKKKWSKWLSKVVIIWVLVLGAYLNSKYIYSAFYIRCEQDPACTLGPSTRLSQIHVPILWRFLILGSSEDMLTTKRPWF